MWRRKWEMGNGKRGLFMPKISSYRELEVWQHAMGLARSIYQLSNAFPAHELYGLTSQLRRCAVSIPSNIAEGHGRRTTKDYLRHLRIAHGSLAEAETQILLAIDFSYVAASHAQEPFMLAERTGRMLNGLIASLEKKLSSPFPDSHFPIPQEAAPLCS